MTIQQHPDYHEGFFDALDGKLLFGGAATPEYRAGWLASHAVQPHFDLEWEDIPSELQEQFPT